MASHKSAAKRARQSIKKNANNRSYVSMVRTAVKNFTTAVDELKKGQGDAAKAQTLLSAAQAVLMRASAKGYFRKNHVSRRVSRFVHQLRAAKGEKK